MLVREEISPRRQSAFSLKSVLMTATIVFFLVLHIIGAVFIHRAAMAQTPAATAMAMSGD
jgi:uncharacterized membrane protein